MDETDRAPRVLLAASECVPFVKTGGLADVAGALPGALKKLGADARVIMPEYAPIKREHGAAMTHICHFDIRLGWRTQYCGIDMLEQDGVTFYFIDNEYYFGRDYIYGDFTSDEGERFAFFSKAILEAMPRIDFFPDVLHLNDWQTGMAAALLKLQYSASPDYARVRTLFTIHNLRYQGVFNRGFMDELLSLGASAFDRNALEYRGCMNFLKAGLVYADVVSTVSPTYAREIRTAYYGETLDGVLRARGDSLVGILNGIDTASYDPAHDKALPAAFSAKSPRGKAECKKALRAELGLDDAENTPIVAIVSRLASQKGFDLVECVIQELMDQPLQLVVLGTGERRYEDLFRWASWRYPGRAVARFEYNDALARRIYAGADMLMMPSEFEPCGLSQLIAMRYGTVPVVRETGGLADTVVPYNRFTGEGNGFSFANYNAHELLYTVQHAVKYYAAEPDMWKKLMRSAMKRDSSWDRSAGEYLALYSRMTNA